MKTDFTVRVVIALLITASFVACKAPTITERRFDSSGGEAQIFTEDEYWKHLVDLRIAAESAGQKPEAKTGHEEWRTFWPWWYSVIRRRPKPTWKSKEFKTSEDMVNYIKEKLRAKGLPTYE
jgi:hypothetical protein